MAREKLGQFLKFLNPENSHNSISYRVNTGGDDTIDPGDDLGRDPMSHRYLLPPNEKTPPNAAGVGEEFRTVEDALLANWISWLQENNKAS